MQESGRAGRDRQPSCALLVYGRKDLRQIYVSDHREDTVKIRMSAARKFCLKTLKAVRILSLMDVCVVMYVRNNVCVENVTEI